MTDKRIWIDPRDCGLFTVEAIEQKRMQEVKRQQREELARERMQEQQQQEERRRERAMRRKEEDQVKTQVLVTKPKQEILAPVSPKAAALSLLDENSLGLPDLSNLERQIREAAKMLDLSVPEGWLDQWFGRPNHRIDVKTERGQRLAGYIVACTAILEAARVHQATRYRFYLDQVAFLRRVAEENCQLELTRRRAERQDTIESAQAGEAIALHEANTRKAGLEGRPVLPPPPSPPPPPPEDPRAKNKLRLQQKLERLSKDETADIDKIIGGRPESEWTDEVREEMKRTANMYFHAKEKVREELREYLHLPCHLTAFQRQYSQRPGHICHSSPSRLDNCRVRFYTVCSLTPTIAASP